MMEKKYVLTFIDDFSHFTVVYCISSKSEVFGCFEAMVTSQFNVKISRFRCDNGREYTSNEMVQYFKERGIRFEYAIRYTQCQDGVAERYNRTLSERARCMMLSWKLPKYLWSEAIYASVYVINRSPTLALQDKVPAEVWSGERQNLKKLRVFGCVAYLRLPKELIGGKFESRSVKCHMLGYCPNGYRLWSVEDKRVIFGHDVVFQENKFTHDELSILDIVQNEPVKNESPNTTKLEVISKIETAVESDKSDRIVRRSYRVSKPPD